LKQQLRTTLQQAVGSALRGISAETINIPEIQLDVPRNVDHGDFSTNIAMVLAKVVGLPPRELATLIVNRLDSDPILERADIAGPGFINLHIADAAFMRGIGQALNEGVAYGRSDLGSGQRVQIEFVSANPTGPLHVGHGRGAAFGAVLANIFKATGHDVSCEYYVNDAGRQMDILAASLWLRYLEVNEISLEFPPNAYQGDYIKKMAAELHRTQRDKFVGAMEGLASPPIDYSDAETGIDELIRRAKSALGETNYAEVHQFARDQILDEIRTDLLQFGVSFDNWFPESSLVESNRINEMVSLIDERGFLYKKEGAQWFKSTNFGDEKDRVVVRENGSATYFASDIAYHADKYERGFDHLVNIWGADHHGYVPRVNAAIEAIGFDSKRLEILLVQFAVLYRDGEKVAMSTRSGEFVTLADLIAEVGRDAARFFYITRRSEQHLVFDLDLAKSQTNENPVYYVQYAHARICRIFKQLQEQGYSEDREYGLASTNRLVDPKEKELAAQILRYPEVVETSARNREPHLITTYLREISASFHGYYHAGHRIISDDDTERNARLVLIGAVKQVIANGLDLLGVSAPEAM